MPRIIEFVELDGTPNKIAFPDHWTDQQIAEAMASRRSPPKLAAEQPVEVRPDERADFFSRRPRTPRVIHSAAFAATHRGFQAIKNHKNHRR